MSSCLLDSDVIIWFLRGRSEVRRWVLDLSRNGTPSCSSLSVLEVAAGARRNEEPATVAFLSSLDVIAPDTDIAWRAGVLIRQYAQRGMTLDLVDAAIAATCIARDLPLASFSRRRYTMPEIHFAPLPEGSEG